MTPHLSAHDDREEPAGCPVCHSDAIRETTPAVPETDRYECERCGHTWAHSGVGR